MTSHYNIELRKRSEVESYKTTKALAKESLVSVVL